jgi:hypothetical protein
MYKIGDKVETPLGIGVIQSLEETIFVDEKDNPIYDYAVKFENDYDYYTEHKLDKIIFLNHVVKPYRTAHDKLIEMGLKLKITKNYADGVFSHEWWNDNDDRVIVFYIDEKVTTVYEGNNEIMVIIPQYLEELEDV